MKLIGLLGFFLLLTSATDSSLLDPVIQNVRHIKATHPPENVSGMWKKKMMWKPRWIKEWKSSNVLKPVWRKFWGPVIIREWVPIPKPPPQWNGDGGIPPEQSGAAPFLDVGEPPVPNFSYLPKTPPAQTYAPKLNQHNAPGFAANHQALPITTGFRSQAETYSGQSSYRGNIDSSAFDLNPPVEQFTPGYSFSQSVPNHPLKPVGATHVHHHSLPYRHHHHHHHHAHTHQSADLTKFPPDWSSWRPMEHASSGLAPAGSAISVVSEIKSTTAEPQPAVESHLLTQGLLPTDTEFIQQAALVSEYHYTENPLPKPTSPTPLVDPHGQDQAAIVGRPISPSNAPLPVLPTTQRQVPDTPRRPPGTAQTHPVQHRPPLEPAHSQKLPPPKPSHAKVPPSFPVHKQNPIKATPVHVHPPPHVSPQANNPATIHLQSPPAKKSPVQPRKPGPVPPQTSNMPPPKKTAPTKPDPLKKSHSNKVFKLPDFKALPSTSVEAFHFIEGFPSNQTLTRAALVGNANQTGFEENQVEIISPNRKIIPPYVAELAQAIVTNHLRKEEEEAIPIKKEEAKSEASTEKASVTVVYPSTNPFVRKTLKAYLAEENGGKSTEVFVVTPVPQEEVSKAV